MKNILRLFPIIAVALLRADAAPNPIESELFPPDFLVAQREALSLSDSQIQAIQAIMQEVQPKFEELKNQMEERVKAVHETLRQTKVDTAQAEEKFRALFTQENEVKLLQMRTMLAVRATLTPEQVEKARQLRPQQVASDRPADALRERLQTKFERLKTTIEARAASGEPPVEIVAQAQEIQQLVQQGKPQEAERRLDALLDRLTDGKSKQ